MGIIFVKENSSLGQGSALTVARHMADTGYRSAPWCDEKEKEVKGVLTTGLLGWCSYGIRPTTKKYSGGERSSSP
jgi:hypothetical protein